jgi:hypothetical protein
VNHGLLLAAVGAMLILVGVDRADTAWAALLPLGALLSVLGGWIVAEELRQ